MKSRYYFYSLLWIFLLSLLCGCASNQDDTRILEDVKTSLTIDIIKEKLNLEEDLVIDYNYYEKIGVQKRGDLSITVIDADLSPVVEINIGKYDSLYKKQYEEKPYKDSGFFEYNKIGSRSYSTLSRNKAGAIVSNQLIFSSSDKLWDVEIFYPSNSNALDDLYMLAEIIDRLLVPV